MLLLLVACSGLCAEVGALPETSTVVLGDSIMAWSSGRCLSVVDKASLASGERWTNAAVNGARMVGGDAPIPAQLPAGTWERVVVIGGGNDLGGDEVCDGASPTATLDSLASEDGASGAMPELVDTLLAAGSEVWVLGYYGVDPRGWYGLGGCYDEIDELKLRYQAALDLRPGVNWLDLEEFMTPADAELYAVDRVHPSEEGTAHLGVILADALDGD